MILRRLTALVAAIGLMLVLASAASAQDTGSTVTINLTTCTVTGSADSATIGESQDPSRVGSDCVDGYPDEMVSSITLDGEAPTSSDATSLTWDGVADGDHVASPGLGIEGEEFSFTVAGEDVSLWATYYLHQEGEGPEATEEDADVSGDDEEASATGDDEATSLPSTGAGPAQTSNAMGITIVLMACATALGIRGCLVRPHQ